jgi:hypothetical protein
LLLLLLLLLLRAEGGHVRLECWCCHLCMLWSAVWCLFLKNNKKQNNTGCIPWKWVLRAFGLRVSPCNSN